MSFIFYFLDNAIVVCACASGGCMELVWLSCAANMPIRLMWIFLEAFPYQAAHYTPGHQSRDIFLMTGVVEVEAEMQCTG